jgi:hypothetical protein
MNAACEKLEGCRRTTFEKLDQPVLRALPPLRYEFADRRNDLRILRRGAGGGRAGPC